MRSFILNITKNIKQAFQPQLVNPQQLAWIETQLSPLRYLYDQFIAHRLKVNYDLTINSQVNRLQKALRDKFELVEINVVTIEDTITESYIYTEAELQDQTLVMYTIAENINDSAIFTDQEINNEIDFIIEVPEGNEQKEIQIKAFVDKYKFAGKKFIIQYL